MNTTHEHGFWTDKSERGHFFDSRLADALAEMFFGQAVIDLGCGSGSYVQHLNSHDIDCVGYDGNPCTEEISDGVCKVADLAEQCFFPQVYDWVLCLEVGEHMPEEFEPCLLDNIHRHNKKGVVISWAVPGQGGRGHVNCRTNHYVQSLFSPLNYRYDWPVTSCLRRAAKKNWFKNTLMVFRKTHED